jgi:UDP-N-acetylglucosamine--N-acetylmuramyl-(pentapeptide) pyrophosphoryl-undecaprenol N-acetylglucosamine transferase
MKKKIFIASGGTGGHIIPARALAKLLSAKNHQVLFLGDEKIKSYIRPYDTFKSTIISSSQIKKSPVFLAKAAIKIGIGFLHSCYLFLTIRPDYVFAFGGYATFPILVAAIIFRSKIILHEQNAHLGKVNRIFAKHAYKIATSFPKTSGINSKNYGKISFTGNPLRDEILELGKLVYNLPAEEKENDLTENRMGYNVLLASDFKEKEKQDNLFKILVIGGSGGAKIFSEILPKAFFNLSDRLKDKIQVTQQCRPELVKSTFDQYCSYNINIAVDGFFDNMPELIRDSHLVIARSGSSSIFEFCMAKKPMILVPFAASADDHQAKNAAYLAENNAAIVISEKDFTIAKVSEVLKELMVNPQNLIKMSENAAKLAKADCAEKLTCLIND